MSMAQLQLLKNNNVATITNNDDANVSLMETFDRHQVSVENITSSIMLLLITNDAYTIDSNTTTTTTTTIKTTSMQKENENCFPIECNKKKLTTTIVKFPLPEGLTLNAFSVDLAISATYAELLLQLQTKSKGLKSLQNNKTNNKNLNMQITKFSFFFKNQQNREQFPFENPQLMPIIMVVQEMNKNKQQLPQLNRIIINSEQNINEKQKQRQKFPLKINSIENKYFLHNNNYKHNNNNQQINNLELNKCAAINSNVKLLQLKQKPIITVYIKFPIKYQANMQKNVFPLKDMQNLCFKSDKILNNNICIESTKNSERFLKNAIKETMTAFGKSLLQQKYNIIEQQQEQQQAAETQQTISEYQVQQQLYNNNYADIHHNKINASQTQQQQQHLIEHIDNTWQIDENMPKITVLMEVALNNAETETINNKILKQQQQETLAEAAGQISAKSEQKNCCLVQNTIRENENAQNTNNQEKEIMSTTTVYKIVIINNNSLNPQSVDMTVIEQETPTSTKIAKELNNRENMAQQQEQLNESIPRRSTETKSTRLETLTATTLILSYDKKSSDVRDQWSQEVRYRPKRQQYDTIDACQFLNDSSSVTTTTTTTTTNSEINVKSVLRNVIDVQVHVVDAVGVLISNDKNNSCNKECTQQQQETQQEFEQFIGKIYKINNINSTINQLQLLPATNTTKTYEILENDCNAMVYVNKNNATAENLKKTTATTTRTSAHYNTEKTTSNGMDYEMHTFQQQLQQQQLLQQLQQQQQRQQPCKMPDVRLSTTISLPSTYRYTLSDTRNTALPASITTTTTSTTANNINNNDNQTITYASNNNNLIKQSYIHTYIALKNATPQITASTNRSVSLDLESVLPERTRMRRQRRMLSQNSTTQQIEDPVERLNRLRARISGALSQVKGVLKQYSTDPDADIAEEDRVLNKSAAVECKNSSVDAEKATNVPETTIKYEDSSVEKETEMPSTVTHMENASGFARARSKSLDISNETQVDNEEQTGPIQFRFVRKVRRRASFFDEKDEETIDFEENEPKQNTEQTECLEIKPNLEIPEENENKVLQMELLEPTAMEALKETENEMKPVKTNINKKTNKKRNCVIIKSTKARRASIAAVERSKIEPPVQMILNQNIIEQRRPSDTEAIVNKHKKRTNIIQTTQTNFLNGLVVNEIKPKIERITHIGAVIVASDIEKCNDNNNKNHAYEEPGRGQNNNNCIVMVNENKNINKDAILLTTTTTSTRATIVALIDDKPQQSGVSTENNNNNKNNHLLIVKKNNAQIEDVKQSNETKVDDTHSAAAMVAMQLSSLQDSITCTTLAETVEIKQDRQQQQKIQEKRKEEEEIVKLVKNTSDVIQLSEELNKIPIVIVETTKESVELDNCNSIARSTVDTAYAKQTSMPELQAVPAPVHLVEHDVAEMDLPFKVPKDDYARKKVIYKKLVRKNSLDKTKTPNKETVLKTEEEKEEEAQAQTKEVVALETETPKSKLRKVKKKVIIKRQQRRLSVSDTGFFRETSNSEQDADNGIANDIETLEKPISYVTEDEQDDDSGATDACNINEQLNEPAVEFLPLKSCLKPREFKVGDAVMYAERYKKTMVRWKKGFVMERITSISYKLDINGKEVPAHISYIKKYTDRKVNFGGKEYLEINYEQIEEEEKASRCYSIWNMV